jgi:hypothetical protein
MLTLAEPRALQQTASRACAVVWIDDASAVVAVTMPDGGFEVSEVHARSSDAWDQYPFLARVVDRIGDRERVLILGPGPARTTLEREYVTIYHRPERLVDVEPGNRRDREHLLERLVTLRG